MWFGHANVQTSIQTLTKIRATYVKTTRIACRQCMLADVCAAVWHHTHRHTLWWPEGQHVSHKFICLICQVRIVLISVQLLSQNRFCFEGFSGSWSAWGIDRVYRAPIIYTLHIDAHDWRRTDSFDSQICSARFGILPLEFGKFKEVVYRACDTCPREVRSF